MKPKPNPTPPDPGGSANEVQVLVRMPERMRNDTKARAAALGLSVSQYLVALAMQDIRRGGPLTLMPATYPMKPEHVGTELPEDRGDSFANEASNTGGVGRKKLKAG